MRPVYENAASKADESRIALVIESLWRCKMEKLPRKNFIDYALMRAEVGLVAYAEVKSRKNPRDQYPTWMVSLEKWMYVKRIAEASNGVPMFFIVEWTDGLYWLRQDTATFSVGVGGRADRNDDMDRELCVFVSVKQFQPLATH